jgi:hypothetical protein
MIRKKRFLLVIGATTAAIGIAAGIRHCLRSMAPTGFLGGASDLCQRRSAHGCVSDDRTPDEAKDQCDGPGALAA